MYCTGVLSEGVLKIVGHK